MSDLISKHLLTIIWFGVILLCHSSAQAQSQFKIFVTVDWEGYSLAEENIAEMQSFRQQFPHIPMVQLLNPVYFVRDPNHAERTSQVIRSTLLPSDIQGLHVHAWRSLVTYCGVHFKNSPSFAQEKACRGGSDCGYTVSLELAYSQRELSKLLACSQEAMVDQGFKRPTYFRAGGWQGGAKLNQSLIENGFVWDSSEIDPNLLTTRWLNDSALVKMLKSLHPNSDSLAQPYLIQGNLWEYPNNAALADYTTTKQIVALFKALIQHKQKVMVLGFHQETAVDYLPRLVRAIKQIEAIASKEGISIEWATH